MSVKSNRVNNPPPKKKSPVPDSGLIPGRHANALGRDAEKQRPKSFRAEVRTFGRFAYMSCSRPPRSGLYTRVGLVAMLNRNAFPSPPL